MDTDADGLNDALEQRLLEQFRPEFRVGATDCAGLPAAFQPGRVTPTPEAEDGTVYGQVFPVHSAEATQPAIEIHFYHLWSVDCGGHGHPLDAEHVAVLLQGSQSNVNTATWRAVFWYAAAHENTVCDVSQIARASTLHAEEHGAIVWISPGKHASYLDEALCNHGCGADRCERMQRLPNAKVINLGEVQRPMNGSVFVGSALWPLRAKMEQTNFSVATLARVEQLPASDIDLYNPGRHPMQGVIAISASTKAAIAGGGESTSGAISMAGGKTTGALATAGDKTGRALGRSFRKTGHALSRSTHAVGKAVGVPERPAPGPAGP